VRGNIVRYRGQLIRSSINLEPTGHHQLLIKVVNTMSLASRSAINGLPLGGEFKERNVRQCIRRRSRWTGNVARYLSRCPAKVTTQKVLRDMLAKFDQVNDLGRLGLT
jgi:hypothetical protein